MGQAYRHDDEDANEAGRMANDIIRMLQAEGRSNVSIIHGILSELQSLTSYEVRHQKDDDIGEK